MHTIRNPFDDSFDTAPELGGRYMSPGTYKVQIKANKLNASRRKPGVVQFIAEFTILESTHAERQPGSDAAYVVSYDRPQAQSNVKAYTAACTGLKFDQVKKEHANAMVSEAQPAAGCILNLIVDPPQGTTREGLPSKYCAHNWSLVQKSELMKSLTE